MTLCYLLVNILKHTIKMSVLHSFSRHELKLLSKYYVFKAHQNIYHEGSIEFLDYQILMFSL